MKTRKDTILPLAALAGLAIATSANATVMTFDGKGTFKNTSIPDTFGDNIAAAETGISVSNGTTPNIDLTWTGGW